jgi:hypothetical protein
MLELVNILLKIPSASSFKQIGDILPAAITSFNFFRFEPVYNPLEKTVNCNIFAELLNVIQINPRNVSIRKAHFG